MMLAVSVIRLRGCAASSESTLAGHVIRSFSIFFFFFGFEFNGPVNTFKACISSQSVYLYTLFSRAGLLFLVVNH